MSTGRDALKLIASILSGIVIGVAGTLITINWQEEKLRFELGQPAAFGEIVYQSLRLSNDGWNPATHVKVFLNHPTVKTRDVRSSPSFNLPVDEPDALGGYDRIRRGETVTITFSHRGPPIQPAMLSIKSDRSVARPMARDGGGIDLFSFLLGAFVWMLLSVLIPAYRDLRKRADRPGGSFTPPSPPAGADR
jgi:hypothetical protein